MLPSSDTFREQLSQYLGHLERPDYHSWVAAAIEQEKMKQQHLQAVIEHLESEVCNLARDTVQEMETSMTHVSQYITTTRPVDPVALSCRVIMIHLPFPPLPPLLSPLSLSLSLSPSLVFLS